jgi:hypothetical protein
MRVIGMPASQSIAVVPEYIRAQFPLLPLAKDTILSAININMKTGLFSPVCF